MNVIHQVEQDTEAWRTLRLGIPTASQFHRIITPQGKPSAQATAYRSQLIAERLFGQPFGKDLSRIEHVVAGKSNQPHAAAQFEALEGVQLQEVGFITSEDGRIGCSPDRLILGNRREAVEIKCPTIPVHVGYLLDGPGTDYRAQVQGQILIGGFEAVHFYAWNERCPAVHMIFRPDLPYLKLLAQALADFCAMLDADEARCRSLGVFIAEEGENC
jgi:hypothetical protein